MVDIMSLDHNMLAYTTTKHAVIGLTRGLAVEWWQYGVRINALCPGLTETEMVALARKQIPQQLEERLNRVPSGLAAQLNDQAEAILFLASPYSSAINGLIMNVDGGQVAMSSGYSINREFK
jgi:NAD(P)-dependent dehydrogenase (short-subunit alcohol dehydrogenase family)